MFLSIKYSSDFTIKLVITEIILLKMIVIYILGINQPNLSALKSSRNGNNCQEIFRA